MHRILIMGIEMRLHLIQGDQKRPIKWPNKGREGNIRKKPTSKLAYLGHRVLELTASGRVYVPLFIFVDFHGDPKKKKRPIEPIISPPPFCIG